MYIKSTYLTFCNKYNVSELTVLDQDLDKFLKVDKVFHFMETRNN